MTTVSAALLALATWHIEDVQFSARSRLRGELLGGVVADVVSVNDVIVPVAGTEFECLGALEAECAPPGSGFGVTVLEHRQRELVLVVVPGAEEVDSLDVRRGTQGKGKLNGGARHGGPGVVTLCMLSGRNVIGLEDIK